MVAQSTLSGISDEMLSPQPCWYAGWNVGFILIYPFAEKPKTAVHLRLFPLIKEPSNNPTPKLLVKTTVLWNSVCRGTLLSRNLQRAYKQHFWTTSAGHSSTLLAMSGITGAFQFDQVRFLADGVIYNLLLLLLKQLRFWRQEKPLWNKVSETRPNQSHQK